MSVSPCTELNDLNVLLKAPEVAEILRSNVKAVYELSNRGLLPCIRIGRKKLFPRQGVIDFINGKTPKQKPKN